MILGTLGIIGYGNMSSAIIKGLIKAELFMPSDIHVYDIDSAKLDKAKVSGHFIHASAAELSEKVDTLLLAVKPGTMPEVLHELHELSEEVLVISIAAGVTITTIERHLPASPVIRIMPNTPGMVGAGVSALATGTRATDDNVEIATRIMGAIGFVHVIPESLMDAVTGLSGSGPAYVAIMIDALSDGGVKMGLPRAIAQKLAAQTVYGTAKMIMEHRIHPAQLRDMVASPGGTTIEGIAALEAGAFRSTLIEAVEAASLRSKELGL